jgi:hypothetical protein
MTDKTLREAENCAMCDGAGTIRATTSHLGPDDYDYDAECPACEGTGSADIADAINALPYSLHRARQGVQVVERAAVLRILAARAALASSPEQAEPVAFKCWHPKARAFHLSTEPPERLRRDTGEPDEYFGGRVEPLYTALGATQPAAPVGQALSPAQRDELFSRHGKAWPGVRRQEFEDIVGLVLSATAPTAPAPATDALEAYGLCRYLNDVLADGTANERVVAQTALRMLSTPPLPQGEKRWPFVESPGQFTERLREAYVVFGDLLAAVRCVLIENPPTLVPPPPAAQPVEHISTLVNRFLTWPLPLGVNPDVAGQPYATGTNLLNAEQAEQMIRHVIGYSALHRWAAEERAAEAAQPVALSDAARDVLTERQRQVSVEGWTPEHDDGHGEGVLAQAAGCYARWAFEGNRLPNWTPPDWPWDDEWWKAGDPRRNLIKAGALILAEIERLDRIPRPDGEAGEIGGAA